MAFGVDTHVEIKDDVIHRFRGKVDDHLEDRESEGLEMHSQKQNTLTALLFRNEIVFHQSSTFYRTY
jgi:hypothetical protein